MGIVPVTHDEPGRVWEEVGPVSGDDPDSGPSPLASFIAIIVVAAILGWIFRPWVGVVFFIVFACTIVLERLGPPKALRVFARVRRLQRRFGAGLQRVLLAVVWALAVVPLSLFRGGRGVMTPKGWREMDSSTAPAFRRQFVESTIRPPSRSGLLHRLAVAVGALALLFAVDLGLGTVYERLIAADAQVDPRANLAAYAGDDWAHDYWTDVRGGTGFKFVPYIGWLRNDYASESVNVRDGERRTWSAQSELDDAAQLWMFGGSTTWGTGQRDDFTIASQLGRLLEDAELPVRVSNFGESAHRSWQENLHLEYRLLAGGRPDMVIFYDGVNEPGRHGELDSPTPLHSREHIFRPRIESPVSARRAVVTSWKGRSLLVRAARSVRSTFRASTPGQSIERSKVVPADRALDNMMGIYNEGVAIGRDIGARHGFEIAHFWQPNIYTKRTNRAEADAWDTPGYRNWDRDWYDAVYNGARDRLPAGVIDITDALDGTDQPVMIDHVHTNELGARLVAERIFVELEQVFRELVAVRESS